MRQYASVRVVLCRGYLGDNTDATWNYLKRQYIAKNEQPTASREYTLIYITFGIVDFVCNIELYQLWNFHNWYGLTKRQIGIFPTKSGDRKWADMDSSDWFTHRHNTTTTSYWSLWIYLQINRFVYWVTRLMIHLMRGGLLGLNYPQYSVPC